MASLLPKETLDGKELNLPSDKFPPKASKIVIERPDGWEFLLFAELIQHYVSELSQMRLDSEYSISFGHKKKIITPQELTTWTSSRLNDLQGLVVIVKKLINEAAVDSFGARGTEGDYIKIQYVCQRYAEVYRRMIEWRLSFVDLIVDKDFEKLIKLVSNFASKAISEIEAFSKLVYKEINGVFAANENPNKPKTLNLELILTMPDLTEYEIEFDRLEKAYFSNKQKIPAGLQIYDDLEVAGIQHRKDVATKFVNQTNQWLEFEVDPLNKFDPNAIKILGCYQQNNETIQLHVGYVPASSAKQISKFSINECMPRLLKTYISQSGYVEILFQVLGPKGRLREYQLLHENTADSKGD